MKGAALLALCCFALVLAACEDMPAGPDLDALVESRGRAGGSGLSLQDLFAVAVVRVQRSEGDDSATAVLTRWRQASEMPVDGGSDAVESSHDRVRQLEAQTVVRAFGPSVVGQAQRVVSAELLQLSPDAERAIGEGTADPVRAALDSVAAALEHASALAPTAPADALVAVARAADRLDDLRATLADTDRFPTLEELHAEAVASLRAAGASRADSLDAIVQTAEAQAREAREAGSLDGSYRGLEEARAARARTVAEALGADGVSALVSSLQEASADVKAALEERQARSLDVARELRMQQTATDLLHRARAAIGEGEPYRAVDLATHAGGLLNELRRQLAR